MHTLSGSPSWSWSWRSNTTSPNSVTMPSVGSTYFALRKNLCQQKKESWLEACFEMLFFSVSFSNLNQTPSAREDFFFERVALAFPKVTLTQLHTQVLNILLCFWEDTFNFFQFVSGLSMDKVFWQRDQYDCSWRPRQEVETGSSRWFVLSDGNDALKVFWPPDDECSVAASGGVGSTAIITVTDMQVGTHYW